VDNLQRVNRGLEQRLALVQSELSTVKAATAATQSEYENYKVRIITHNENEWFTSNGLDV